MSSSSIPPQPPGNDPSNPGATPPSGPGKSDKTRSAYDKAAKQPDQPEPANYKVLGMDMTQKQHAKFVNNMCMMFISQIKKDQAKSHKALQNIKRIAEGKEPLP